MPYLEEYKQKKERNPPKTHNPRTNAIFINTGKSSQVIYKMEYLSKSDTVLTGKPHSDAIFTNNQQNHTQNVKKTTFKNLILYD